jgi:hypothetical protein
MFTVSRLAKSTSLVLLAATLTTAAYAGGGGHGGGGGHSGSNGSTGPAVHSAPVHSNMAIVFRHDGKTLSHVSHSKTAIVSKHGGKTLSNGPAAPPNATVRDHRGSEDEIGNTVGGPCYGGCVGQGGLSGAQPSQNQDHSTGSGTPQVHDHRN